MYQLYVNKKEYGNKYELKVKPLQAAFKKRDFVITDEIMRHNNNYYFCKNRKSLIEKAKQIKQEWINEVEQELGKLKDIKI